MINQDKKRNEGRSADQKSKDRADAETNKKQRYNKDGKQPEGGRR